MATKHSQGSQETTWGGGAVALEAQSPGLPSAPWQARARANHRFAAASCDLPALAVQGSNVVEDQDLLEIGILNSAHRQRLLQAIRLLPRVGVVWMIACGSGTPLVPVAQHGEREGQGQR
ncbi:hypothetical protein Z043_111436 [Scleropages formosus]|uniref:SAM domain-containing protein n=1 Tax=Scleropages formosus TaxID=113540 RepID=A0A0P7UM16_SCLFO|nr:hypothetical protein Z043_111436 [Scleropages formosus]